MIENYHSLPGVLAQGDLRQTAEEVEGKLAETSELGLLAAISGSRLLAAPSGLGCLRHTSGFCGIPSAVLEGGAPGVLKAARLLHTVAPST